MPASVRRSTPAPASAQLRASARLRRGSFLPPPCAGTRDRPALGAAGDSSSARRLQGLLPWPDASDALPLRVAFHCALHDRATATSAGLRLGEPVGARRVSDTVPAVTRRHNTQLPLRPLILEFGRRRRTWQAGGDAHQLYAGMCSTRTCAIYVFAAR
eukprot:scaffold8780_cov130-Isochrysis_galbana.AAC.9